MPERPFKSLGIQATLSLAIAVLVTGLLVVSAAVLYWSERRMLLGKMEEAHRSLVVGFAQTCADALVAKDPLAAVNAVQAIHVSPVVEAVCLDASRRVVAHTDHRRIGELHAPPAGTAESPVPGFERRRWSEPGRGGLLGFTQRFPIGQGGQAAAVVVFSESAIRRAVRAALLGTSRRILVVFSAALLVGLATALLLARGLTGPIRLLADTACRIGRGEFETRVDIRSTRELRELGDTFNQTAEALAQLDRMKDDFISLVSHDLRSPLGAIQMFAETLRDGRHGPVNDAQKRYLSVVLESARSLIAFVNDVLDLAKVRAGRMEYRPTEVDLAGVTRRVVDLFKELAGKKGVRFDMTVPEGLRVRADAGAVERAVTNYLSNALKVVPEGQGVVSLRAAGEDGFVRFSVQDNGPGITPEDRPRLFQKFNQLATGPLTVRTRTVGTGLGLTLVKNMIEAQGGEVGLESPPGKGALFFFRLPKA